MDDRMKGILFDPVVGQLVSALLAVLLVVTIVRLLQRYVSRYVRDGDVRYKTRKAIGIVGYLVGFVLVQSVFSTRLGQLTVALGVAGAGIAFALQEVIASVAGWLAVSLGGSIVPATVFSLGASRAMSSTSASCARR